MRRLPRVQTAIAGLLVMAILALNLQGCASPTATGAGAGAGVGAAIGAAVSKKNPLLGALIGGVAGALVGAAIGYAYEVHVSQGRSVKDYQTTKTEVGYEPSHGEVVRVASYILEPAAVSPGNNIVIKATYYVMTPNPDQDVAVTEAWSLSQFRKEDGKVILAPVKEIPPRPVTVKPGTNHVDGTIPLKENAPEGDYSLAFKVSQNGRSDQKSLRFTVTKDQAKLTAPGSKMTQITAPPLAAIGERQPSPPPPPVPQPAQSPTQHFVASKVSGKGNVRDGPGKDYKIVAAVQKGERFPILDSVKNPKEEWHKIRLEDGREAWVHGSLGAVEQ